MNLLFKKIKHALSGQLPVNAPNIYFDAGRNKWINYLTNEVVPPSQPGIEHPNPHERKGDQEPIKRLQPVINRNKYCPLHVAQSPYVVNKVNI